MPPSLRPERSRRRLRIGRVWIDALSFAGALDEIEKLVDSGQGGAVYTPNVDHVIKAESNDAFRRAYEHCSLSLADGMPLGIDATIGYIDPDPLNGLTVSDFAIEYGRSAKTVEPGAMARLRSYRWPGNVRELRNVIERLVLRVQGPTIEPDALPVEIASYVPAERQEQVREVNRSGRPASRAGPRPLRSASWSCHSSTPARTPRTNISAMGSPKNS